MRLLSLLRPAGLAIAAVIATTGFAATASAHDGWWGNQGYYRNDRDNWQDAQRRREAWLREQREREWRQQQWRRNHNQGNHYGWYNNNSGWNGYNWR